MLKCYKLIIVMSIAKGRRGDFNNHINTTASALPSSLSVSLSKHWVRRRCVKEANAVIWCLYTYLMCSTICGQGRSLANFLVCNFKESEEEEEPEENNERAAEWEQWPDRGDSFVSGDRRRRSAIARYIIAGWLGAGELQLQEERFYWRVVVDESIWTKHWTESMYA